MKYGHYGHDRCQNPMKCGQQKQCSCHKSQTKPAKEVVHPVKEDVVHKNTKEVVKHIHPSHTTVMNHHVVENQHVYPHSTSVKNSVEEVDMYGNQVGGVMNQKPPCKKKGHGHHHHHHGCHHHGGMKCGRRRPRWF